VPKFRMNMLCNNSISYYY